MIPNPPALRIVFAGTPEFAIPTLDALFGTNHTISAVYTQPDRPAGRGRRLRASPVKVYAERRGILVRQPRTLRESATVEALAALRPDLVVVVAYGLILPSAVLAIPRLGCVNVHASLLPRWRGAAPIQRALLAGDEQTGVSIMRMTQGLDSGPVFGTASCTVMPEMTGGELHDRLAALGAETLIRLLPALATDSLEARPQDEGLACYAPKLEKTDAILDWSRPARTLQRQVLALNPWPVAQTEAGGRVLRIWRARADSRPVSDAAPGRVLSQRQDGISVATGSGTLSLTEVQFPGGRPMPVAEFLNGHTLQGITLGQP